MIVENYVRARSLFNRKYENNQIFWTGNFVDIKIPQNDGVTLLLGTPHALNVLVKMTPSESTINPDLVLSVSSALLEHNRDLFTNDIKSETKRPKLKQGDEILFKARFM